MICIAAKPAAYSLSQCNNTSSKHFKLFICNKNTSIKHAYAIYFLTTFAEDQNHRNVE